MKRVLPLFLCVIPAFFVGCSGRVNPYYNIPDMGRGTEIAESARLESIESRMAESDAGIGAEAVQKAAEKQNTAEHAVAEEPAGEQPVAENPAANEPTATEQPNAEQIAAEQTDEAQPIAEGTATENQTADEQAAHEQAAAEQAEAERVAREQEAAAAEAPAVEPPAGEQVPAESQATDEAATGEQPGGEPGLDFAALAPSTQMSYAELTGDSGVDEDPGLAPPAGTYRLEIDTTNNVLIVFDQEGNIVRLMRCTTGKSGTRTPRGDYRIGSSRKRFGYFREFDCYAQYWTQVVDGIYIHSVLYRKRDASTLIRSSYRNLGRSSSHGCIRLTVPDARWIYENIAKGTEVNIIKKERDEALRAGLTLPPIE